VLKTQGRRGEVAVATHTDVPDRFSVGMRLWALGEDGARRQMQIEELWPHQRALVLKFAGVDSISDAETLVGCELQVPSAERAKLDAGWAYVSDLVGCAVWDGEREIGVVKDVQFGAGEAPLLIVGDKNYEIPFAEAYLKNVDVEHKRIVMQLPEGLLEVNAPLTAEEKESQKRSE
jgi:16S rRNA processing protein RimM